MAVYLLERNRKLRWISQLRHQAGWPKQTPQPLMTPLWWTIPIQLYCLTTAAVILSLLL
jgi:hypothetical protein